MAKVYRVLDPGEERTPCKFVLVNKMQCWQLGSQEVTEVVRGPDNNPLTLVYQYCERHVKIQQAIDTGQLPAPTETGLPQGKGMNDSQQRLERNLADELALSLSTKAE